MDGKVQIELDAALALRNYIMEFGICSEINALELEAHIEKLENRLKALGGK